MLAAACSDWPMLTVVSEAVRTAPAESVVGPEHADLSLRTGGRLTIDRKAGTARYGLTRRLTDDELVHPYLAPAAAVMSHWLNRLTFHAGAYAASGGTWAVVGDREAGKSSTLAALALDGHHVVTDDLLVVDDGMAHVGPRSVDLRETSARRLGAGVPLGVVGARPRWRLKLPDDAPKLPLRGWAFLAWGDSFAVRRLPPTEALRRLSGQLTLPLPVGDPARFLELAGLPAWELQRPRKWQQLPATVEWLASIGDR
jgi:hypothetical protein